MDFDFTPAQDEAAILAARILTDKATPERMREVEGAGDRFDRELWSSMAGSGLLSLAIPEEYDGAGLGLIELVRVLIEVGRTVAPVPLATHGPASFLLAEAGSDHQKQSWLPGAATGSRLLTAAVSEDGAHLPASPAVTAERGADAWTLDGTKTIVRAGTVADLLLVTATTDQGPGVFLVEPGSDGVRVQPQHTSDGDVVARIELSDVVLPADALVGTTDGTAARRLGQLVTVCAAAEQLGVVRGAVALTAAYAKSREQFGRPIGTFQAVSQRLADGYIDGLLEELALWQAVWRVSEGLPAEVEVASAKLWAADAGHRVAHTTVHVHGGVGIDLDGEAHRYFTAAKRFEFSFGGATEQALTIGRALAGESS
ncbi:acyl-CoA/acyl-ACP dehydrogenase [Nocardioides sp. JQ2195]|uniref:acyl-CoA dehydrogenase family protein n=1 Tax=Nocardioides sp. JQ2195 TaxID=2592334 RepID=UPI00143E194F|nr:acyl-CoA dehydrogenase family protein [Nocardioides sp. JQ2195]QIX26813.1 acyl-CoA/acyl-ACP dehydrogenase [Nocardioides sp. JQ2195]